MAEIFSLEESHSELKSVRKANCVVFSCDFFPPHPRCFINRAWSYIDDIEDTRCRCIREHVWSFSPILGLYSALQLDAAFLQSFAHCDCCPWMRPTRGVSFHSPEWRLTGRVLRGAWSRGTTGKIVRSRKIGDYSLQAAAWPLFDGLEDVLR